MGVSEEGDIICFILANKKKQIRMKSNDVWENNKGKYENEDGLVEANLVSSIYCSVYGEYIVSIRVKVLREKDLREKKFKNMKYLVGFFYRPIFVYNLKIRLYLCSLSMPTLST